MSISCSARAVVLDRAQMRHGRSAEIEEKFVLELARAFLRAENLRLHLLQLGRDETLRVGHASACACSRPARAPRLAVLISM